jgi:hypothetical protein
MTKKAGSGSGYISQRHGSADPDPDPLQNVMDPEQCIFHIFQAVLQIKIRIEPPPNPELFCTDSDPDPSIIEQISKKNLDFYCSVHSS